MNYNGIQIDNRMAWVIIIGGLIVGAISVHVTMQQMKINNILLAQYKATGSLQGNKL